MLRVTVATAICCLGFASHASTDAQRMLVAQRACSGVKINSGIIAALKLGQPPFYYYTERWSVEWLFIATQYCPSPQGNAEFAIGRRVDIDTDGFPTAAYYKVSVQSGEILEAARSYVDPVEKRLIYESIAPMSESASGKVYSPTVQQDFDALMTTILVKWGHK